MSDLERRLRAYVATGSGLDRTLVIPGNDDGPVPQEHFASVTLIDDSTIGQPNEKIRNMAEGARADLLITHEATYSIQFYREGANATAERFVEWLDTPLAKLEEDRVLPEFNGARFRVENPLTMRNVAEIITDEFEERIAIDLTIGYLRPASQDVGRVEEVPLEVNDDEVSIS